MAAPIYVHVPLRRTNNACERKRSGGERIFVVALNEFRLEKFCSTRILSETRNRYRGATMTMQQIIPLRSRTNITAY